MTASHLSFKIKVLFSLYGLSYSILDFRLPETTAYEALVFQFSGLELDLVVTACLRRML